MRIRIQASQANLYSPAKSNVGLKLCYFIVARCFSVEAMYTVYIYFFKEHHFEFLYINLFPPLEPKLLVMWEGIGEELYCLVTMVLTLECAAFHGMALELLAAKWYHYIGEGKYREALNTHVAPLLLALIPRFS
jgi:hypothetical protein